MREMGKERNGKAGKREGDYSVLELMLACSLEALFNIKLLLCFVLGGHNVHYSGLTIVSVLSSVPSGAQRTNM